MVDVYSKANCPNCVKIKNELDSMNVDYNYYTDELYLTEKAIELKTNGELIEMIAPLIIKDGKQIKHKEINKLKGE